MDQGLQASCSSRWGVARSTLVQRTAWITGMEGRADTVEVRTQQAGPDEQNILLLYPPIPVICRSSTLWQRRQLSISERLLEYTNIAYEPIDSEPRPKML